MFWSEKADAMDDLRDLAKSDTQPCIAVPAFVAASEAPFERSEKSPPNFTLTSSAID